jgi:hypothetical protein
MLTSSTIWTSIFYTLLYKLNWIIMLTFLWPRGLMLDHFLVVWQEKFIVWVTDVYGIKWLVASCNLFRMTSLGTKCLVLFITILENRIAGMLKVLVILLGINMTSVGNSARRCFPLVAWLMTYYVNVMLMSQTKSALLWCVSGYLILFHTLTKTYICVKINS